MLDSLINITGTGEFEDDGSFCITHAEYIDADLHLQLDLKLPNGTSASRAILCRQPRSHHILMAEHVDQLLISDNHFLIWPHSQPQFELYFHGRAQDSRTLLGALLMTHVQIFGENVPFPHFMNSAIFSQRVDLLNMGFGLLATGPETAITAYRTVLTDFHIRHSSPPPHEPKWWNGSSWQTEKESLYLLMMGDSFVVAPEFLEVSA
jgi:hypothetical protein